MKTLAATFVAMLFVDTIGGIDQRHPLPSPRRYLATFLLWGLLGLVVGFGERAARLAGRLSAVVLLTAVVVGPFGKRAVGLIQNVTATTQEGTTP